MVVPPWYMKEGDVKVPIEDARDEVAEKIENEDVKEEAAEELETESVDDSAEEAEPVGERELTPEEEAEMVEAAKRAGAEAAEADIKAEEARQAEEEAAREEADALGSDGIDALKGVAAEMLSAAKKEAAEAKDRYVRLQADWDNYRRRTAAERLAEKERAAEKLVTNLLPVLDDMERACDHADATGDENLAQFVDGVKAIHDKMLGILAKEGVEVIDPVGEPFDPLAHQAVGRQEDKDAYEETVAQVYQKGYRMGGKVIRAAMVTVTYGGPRRPVEEKADE